MKYRLQCESNSRLDGYLNEPRDGSRDLLTTTFVPVFFFTCMMPSTTAFFTALTLFSAVRGNSITPDDITGEFQSGFVDHGPSLLSNIGGYNDSIILNQRSGNLFPPLFARQQRVCPDPGGPSCSATKCCRTGEKCVSSSSSSNTRTTQYPFLSFDNTNNKKHKRNVN